MKNLNRRQFLRQFSTTSVGTFLSVPFLPKFFQSGSKINKKPNIIFIMADDCSRDWLGCYGSKENVTPNLDKLAEEGIRFETFWVTPLCTPTRNMLLTGRYPFRTGWIAHYDTPRWGGQFFDWNREITFARVLKQAGYSTAIGGKWQINDFRVHPDALKRHGFDEHCIWSGFESGNSPSEKRYWDAYLITNGVRKIHKGEYGPDVVNEFLLDFIKRHKNGPFLVYYPMILTHGPYEPTPFNKNSIKDSSDKKELYSGMVQYADYLIGRLVEELDNLGIRENTVIFYTGDNGSSTGGKAWGEERLNKGKGKRADIGVHTPLIVNWPGTIRPGQVTDELSDISDMLPTFAELAGASLPRNVKIDGQSIVSILLGQEGPRRKWIFSQLGKERLIRDKRYILHSDGRFYDLKTDPYEKNNLANSKDPEIIKAKIKLKKVLNSFPPDKKLTGFPPSYEELGKVPDLPPGSGKWKKFKVTKVKNKNRASKQ